MRKKVSDIAERLGVNAKQLESWIRIQGDIPFGVARGGLEIDEGDVEDVVERYKYDNLPQVEKDRLEREKQEKEAQEKNKLSEAEMERLKQERERDIELSKIMISSGFGFDGYRIVKYSGYISGDDATEIPRGGWFSRNNGQNLTDALVKIRRQALRELKEAAYDLGCNAVIGVDFDYITLEPETANITGGTTYEPYVICVTANGNAVIIERE